MQVEKWKRDVQTKIDGYFEYFVDREVENAWERGSFKEGSHIRNQTSLRVQMACAWDS